jgi:hypothetical protein
MLWTNSRPSRQEAKPKTKPFTPWQPDESEKERTANEAVTQNRGNEEENKEAKSPLR